MVPEDAILQRSDGSVLFRIADDGTAERLRVKTGVYDDGLVEIASGISPGDSIIVRGQTNLIHGAVVSIREANGALPAEKSAENSAPLRENAAAVPTGVGG